MTQEFRTIECMQARLYHPAGLVTALVPSIPPIIFLDVDGVLNAADWYESHDYKTEADNVDELEDWRMLHLDRSKVARLRRLTLNSGARLVISSTWRLGGGRASTASVGRLAELLSVRGFPEAPLLILGATPYLGTNHPRREEIELWLDEMFGSFVEHIPHYVILDDDADACIEGHFVHTSRAHGLTDERVEAAYRVLGAKR